MGWLFMQRLDGHKGPKDYLDAQFTYKNDQSQLRVLRSTLVNRRVYYAAAERILTADNKRSVFAIVCLVKWAPRARDDTFSATRTWMNPSDLVSGIVRPAYSIC